MERREVKQPKTVAPADVLGPLDEFELKGAPRKRFPGGDASLPEDGPRIAAAGSRRASSGGQELARRIAEVLVSHGVAAAGGLAPGIDTLAHEAAMARGGGTVGVLGTALDRYAVRRHRSLRDAIRRTASAGVSVPVRSARAPVELPPAQQDHGAAAGCRADRRGGRQQRGRGTRAGRRSGWGGPRSFPSGRSKDRRRTGTTRGFGTGLSASTQPPGIGADEDQQPGRPQGPPPPMANPKPMSSARATA